MRNPDYCFPTWKRKIYQHEFFFQSSLSLSHFSFLSYFFFSLSFEKHSSTNMMKRCINLERLINSAPKAHSMCLNMAFGQNVVT